MKKIKIINDLDQDKYKELNIDNWPEWEKDESEFPWTYEATETCYIEEGEIIVTPDDGDPVRVQEGDLVTFPAGLSCRWEIVKGVKKKYNFD